MKKIFILIIFLICFSSSFSKEEYIYVVMNKNTPVKLSCEEVKLIYLKEIRVINGITLIPVNLPANNPVRTYFRKYILNMDEEELSIYWNEMYYEGITPPIVLKSQEAVRRFIKKVKGAIGYLTKKYIDKSMKIICSIKVEK